VPSPDAAFPYDEKPPGSTPRDPPLTRGGRSPEDGGSVRAVGREDLMGSGHLPGSAVLEIVLKNRPEEKRRLLAALENFVGTQSIAEAGVPGRRPGPGGAPDQRDGLRV